MEKESKKPIEIVGEVEKELKKFLNQFMKGWDEETNIYYGDIWENNQNRPFENNVFEIIEGELPVLTDSISGITANVEDPEYMDQAKNLVKAVEWVLKKEQFQIKHPQLVRDSLVAAPGYLYIDHDINGRDGDGAIKLEILPYYQVRLDGAVSLLEDSAKDQIDLYRRKNWLKTRYPKFADEISSMKAKSDSADKHSDRGRETQDTGGRNKRSRPMRHTADDILKLQITYIKDTSLEDIPIEETAQLLEEENELLTNGDPADVNIYQDHDAHIESHQDLNANIKESLGLSPEASFEEVETVIEQLLEQNPDGDFANLLMILKINENHIEEHSTLKKENPKGGRLKYPGGWRVIETIQKTVVYDGTSRYDHNEFPVVPWYCYKDGTIYGFSEVRNLVDSQRMQAVMSYKEYKGLQKVANPSLAIFKDSGLTKDDVTNEDGGVYEIKDGSKPPVHIQPGVVSEQVSRFNANRSQKMQDISGINEATQGKMPTPQTAAMTVEKVQNQAIGRIRLKDRLNDHYSMKRLGRLIASNIIQFWTTEKVLRLENKDGSHEAVIFNPLDMQDLDFEIDIAPGSMAGVDKDSYNAMLMGFLQSQHITFDQFLEVADIPKAEKLRELTSTEQQKAEAMEALQMELLQMKGQFTPEALSEEEVEILEQSEMMGANQGQPAT